MLPSEWRKNAYITNFAIILRLQYIHHSTYHLQRNIFHTREYSPRFYPTPNLPWKLYWPGYTKFFWDWANMIRNLKKQPGIRSQGSRKWSSSPWRRIWTNRYMYTTLILSYGHPWFTDTGMRRQAGCGNGEAVIMCQAKSLTNIWIAVVDENCMMCTLPSICCEIGYVELLNHLCVHNTIMP